MKKALTTLALVAALSGSPSSSASLEERVSPIKQATEEVMQGSIALKNKDYDSAISHYEAFFAINDSLDLHLDLNPNMNVAALRANLVQAYDLSGEREKAFDFVNEAVSYYPENLMITRLQSIVAENYRDDLVSRIRKDDNLNSRLELSRVFLNLGEFSHAEDQLNTVISRDETCAEAYAILGNVNIEEANYVLKEDEVKAVIKNSEAIINLNTAKELGYSEAELFYNLAAANYNLRNPLMAEKYLLEGIELHPEDDRLYHLLSFVYQEEIFDGKNSEEFFEKAKSLVPERAIYRGEKK